MVELLAALALALFFMFLLGSSMLRRDEDFSSTPPGYAPRLNEPERGLLGFTEADEVSLSLREPSPFLWTPSLGMLIGLTTFLVFPRLNYLLTCDVSLPLLLVVLFIDVYPLVSYLFCFFFFVTTGLAPYYD